MQLGHARRGIPACREPIPGARQENSVHRNILCSLRRHQAQAGTPAGIDQQPETAFTLAVECADQRLLALARCRRPDGAGQGEGRKPVEAGLCNDGVGAGSHRLEPAGVAAVDRGRDHDLAQAGAVLGIGRAPQPDDLGLVPTGAVATDLERDLLARAGTDPVAVGKNPSDHGATFVAAGFGEDRTDDKTAAQKRGKSG